MSGGSHHVEAHDSLGKIVGVQVAIIAVLLSISTILAHRAHTDTILYANQASNSWSHYQAKRIRAYQVEMNTGLVKLLAPNSTEATKTLEEYTSQTEKYTKDLEGIKHDAEHNEQGSEHAHHQAGYFDLTEGLFEIAMILSSLFFISRKKFFPAFGLAIGSVGLIVGILGLLAH